MASDTLQDADIHCGRCGTRRDITLGKEWAGGDCPECGYTERYRLGESDNTIEVESVEVF